MGFLSWYVRSATRGTRRRRSSQASYHGQVLNASGQVIWRCDCNHRSMTAATRCARREAAWLNGHPEQMAQLKPLSWWQKNR
jgi:hypothetical protein